MAIRLQHSHELGEAFAELVQVVGIGLRVRNVVGVPTCRVSPASTADARRSSRSAWLAAARRAEVSLLGCVIPLVPRCRTCGSNSHARRSHQR